MVMLYLQKKNNNYNVKLINVYKEFLGFTELSFQFFLYFILFLFGSVGANKKIQLSKTFHSF